VVSWVRRGGEIGFVIDVVVEEVVEEASTVIVVVLC
jgi:hypothetical protein